MTFAYINVRHLSSVLTYSSKMLHSELDTDKQTSNAGELCIVAYETFCLLVFPRTTISGCDKSEI